MKVNIKKLHPDAVIPRYAKTGDAGLDMVAVSDAKPKFEADSSILYQEYETGLALEIPEGYVGYIFPRSSISNKELILANCVGVIDSGYRGEIRFRFKVTGANQPSIYKKGDKIGQLIIMPIPGIELIEVDELSDSERGEGGFGSTDEPQPPNEHVGI